MCANTGSFQGASLSKKLSVNKKFSVMKKPFSWRTISCDITLAAPTLFLQLWPRWNLKRHFQEQYSLWQMSSIIQLTNELKGTCNETNSFLSQHSTQLFLYRRLKISVTSMWSCNWRQNIWNPSTWYSYGNCWSLCVNDPDISSIAKKKT